jgi:outer membrane protein OmpA-like peptidoglycan-associated protein/uncharacterized protein YidB (DUF937 family)
MEDVLMIDALIDQVAGRFGLGADKVRQLLGMLTGLMFNQPGGFAGFLDRFKQQGMGDMVQSWMGGGPKQPISPGQVETALGASAIGDMSSKLGMDRGSVTGALSGLLPGVIGSLTEGGKMPTSIPASLAGLIGGGAAAVSGGARAAAAAGGQVVDTASRGIGRWLPWIAIIALALIAFLAFRSCKREVAPVATVPTPATVAAPAITPPAIDLPDAGAALDALVGRTFSADELVKALNLMTIHFETDSARISADSNEILAKAASVIKAAPAGTRIEVGGHTDNTGDAAANMTLSRDRAAAVVTTLVSNGVDAAMLTSQGYGQDKPVADNNTEEGRAKNRRMEFTVLR